MKGMNGMTGPPPRFQPLMMMMMMVRTMMMTMTMAMMMPVLTALEAIAIYSLGDF